MILTPKGRKTVNESPLGVYVWRCADGEYLGDSEGRLLSVNSVVGDREKIEAIRKVAANLGYGEGEAVFWSGNRKVTDEEFEEQVDRQKSGLVPDPYDIAAMEDQIRASRND